MKRIVLISTMLSLGLLLSAQYNVINTEFYSPVLNQVKPIKIYLPPGYYNDSTEHYPVVYFLHGANGDQNSYPGMISWTQTLINNGTIHPVIVVFANGDCPPYWGSGYTNSVLYGNYEDYIVYDLVSFIDTTFRTITQRQYRCITGHSMGGGGSARLAANHPDIYRGFASHAGTMNFDTTFSIWQPLVMQENGGSPPYTYTWGAGTFTNFLFTGAGAMSPNLNNPPTYVDFPMGADGNLIDSIFVKWKQHDNCCVIKQISPSDNLGIFFSCGTNDDYHLYSSNELFSDTLDMLGLSYVFLTTAGDHNLSPEMIQEGWKFMDSLMFIATGIDEPTGHSTFSNKNFFVFPNPAKDNITISSPAITGITQLSIFNVSGKKVIERQLTNNEDHIDISGLPRGVYFVRVQNEKMVELGKMVKE